jgi:hypothetical protein
MTKSAGSNLTTRLQWCRSAIRSRFGAVAAGSSVVAVAVLLVSCSPDRPAGPGSSIIPASGPQLAVNTPFNDAGQCMVDDVADFGGGPTNCTANDIRIARADVSQVNGNDVVPNTPIQCTPGQNITVTMSAVLEATSNSNRDDIGVWIATDGGDAKTGACRHYNLVVGSTGTINGTGGETADACAGMAAGAQTTLDLDTFTIPCNTVIDPNTNQLALKIGSCLSWKVPGQDELCPRGFTTLGASYTAEDFRAATIPGTPAKCNCEGFYIPVEVVSSITIIKDAVPNNAQDFAYTATGAGMSAFSLDDDADATLSNTKVFSSLVNDGTARSVTESALPSGWSLTNLSCVSTGATSTISTSGATATITLRNGENVTCTYTNTATASLDIEKTTVGGTGSFDFTNTGTGIANFSRSTTTNNPSQNAPISFSGATVAGDKYVQETGLPAGWSLTNISCTANGATIVIGSGGSGAFVQGATTGYDTGDNTVRVTLAPGSTPSCVFTNTLAATITVSKVCVGGTGVSFDYTGTTPTGTLAPFSLACGASSQVVSTSSAFGAYGISETAKTGWDLTNLQCTGGGGNTSVTGSTATVGLDAGENVTCTYTNTKRGTIVIVKDAVPNDAQDFAFTSTVAGNTSFSLDDDADNTLSNTKTMTNVLPGSYTVTETALTGWDLTSLVCVDPTTNSSVNLGTGVATINLAAGETVTCTYTNTKRGTVIIEKQTNPDGVAGSFPFTQNVDGTGAFNLSDNGTKTFSNVVPNTGTGYTVTEGATAGFSLQSLSCTNPDGLNASSVSGAVATIRVNPGETVTCTYTNLQLATLSLLKVENGGLPLTLAWQFQLRTGASPGVAGTIVASASAVLATGVVQFSGYFTPGNYQLCEVGMPAGYTNNLTGFTPGLDNSEECVNITLVSGTNGPGGITNVPNPIDNIRPPGGDARTIGYWANWSSCTGGKQWDQALKRDIWNKTLDGNLPQTVGLLVLDGAAGEDLAAADCADAVNILKKSDLSGKKMASDPAYNLAAQLLAAMLNYTAGAKQCAAATTAINSAQALLVAIGFNGTGTYKSTMTAQQISDALSLATTLDQYNNNLLCP